RADEAQRVSDYLGVIEKSKLLRERLLAVSSTVVAAGETAVGAAKAEWLRLWEPCGFTPGTPDAMQQWRRDRQEITRRSDSAEDARGRCEDLTNRRDIARKALSELVPPTTADEPLASLLRRAEQQCATLEQAEQEYRQLTQSAAREVKLLEEREQDVVASETALREWQETWAPAVTTLGLPDKASVDDAQASLGAWAQIAELAPAWQSDKERVSQMADAIECYANDIAKVGEALAERSDDSPIVVSNRLTRRLAEARNEARKSEELRDRIKGHDAERTAAEQAAAEIAQELAEMRCLAGASSDAELEQAIERAASRTDLTGKVTDLERQLLVQGDGLNEAALRAEAAVTQKIDLAAARIEEIEHELHDLAEKRDQLNKERIHTEDRIAEMRRGRNAAAHAQGAADAIAEATLAAERYARLHVARVLLRSGIDRFRSEQQDPMLRRAGAHFSLLTDRRYVRLGTDEDQAGSTKLLAVRNDGTECPLEALSDGTRDQLYLALRIAAIEAQADRGDLLPFIADDLLVNFDNDRSASAIHMLLRLGEIMEVILFTHHEHVANLAAEQKDVSIIRLPSPFAEVDARAAE
ncbi:MAG: ATP-binding protein, partial [Acetobacteraceae bacterium]